MRSSMVVVALLSSALAHGQANLPGDTSLVTLSPATTTSREQVLASAHKVALVGALGQVAETGIGLNPSAKKAQELLEKEVHKWGRFAVVDNPAQADLVLILFEGNRAAGGGGTIRTARLAVFPGGPAPKRGDIPLWDGSASGSIFATSGAPKVVSQFRAYLEKLDKIAPAAGNTGSATPPRAPAIAEGVPATRAEASDVAATAKAAPSPAASTMPNRPAKYIPPFDIIGKAKTYTLRGKGTAGEQGAFDKAFGLGKYGNLQSAMGDIYQQMRDWHRMEYVEEVSKADLVILVYQWDERAYSRQFHGVRSAIQISEGGVQFQRGDPAFWASGTVNGSTKDLIGDLRFELDRFPPAQALEATHVANKDYDRGCDRIDSAEEKTGEERSDLLFEAVAELRKSLRADYGYAPAHERLAAALGQLGFDANAVYEYNLALQLQPSMQEALDGLAREGFPH